MADEDNSAATQPQQAEKLHCDAIAHLAKRLYPVANGVAQALLPIVYLQTDAQATSGFVQQAYALSGVLSTFLDDLTLEVVSRDGDQSKDMWSKGHHEQLTRSLEECYDLFLEIARAVRIADEYHHVRGLKAEKDYTDNFRFDNERQARDLAKECFRLVGQTRSIVKHTCLTRFENLNTEEIQEALRLNQALQTPDFDAVWVLRDELFASQKIRVALTPTQPAVARSTNLPGIRSLSSPQDLILDNHTKPVWAYGIWSPVDSSGNPAYGATSAVGHRFDSKTPSATPHLAPYASTSKQKQGPSHGKERVLTTNPKPKGEPGAVAFGEPSVIKPHSSGKSLFGKDTPSDVFANWKPSGINAFNPSPHLEAYIIRPLVETTGLVSKLSHKLDPLRLSDGVLQAQIQNLGSDYSIMDALLDLQPHVLDLVQSRASQRQGNIVSVKYGVPVDVSTSIGSLQVKSTVFIISTTTMLPQDPIPVPALLTNPSDSVFKPATGHNPFSNIASTSGFGSSKINIANPHLSSPEAYSKYLQEQGELCTYVDRNETQCLQHYQTITANKKWDDQDRSLEEIRLADYTVGRQELKKNGAVSSPWGPAPTFGLPGSHGPSQVTIPTTKSAVTQASDLPQNGSPSYMSNNNAWNAWISSQRTSDQERFNPFSGGPQPKSIPINNEVGPFFGTPIRSPNDPLYSTTGTRPSSEIVTDNQGFCTRQHLHGPFCRIRQPPDEGGTPATASSTESSASAKVGSSVESAPKLRLFGGDLATNTSVSPFGTLMTGTGNQLFTKFVADQASGFSNGAEAPQKYTNPVLFPSTSTRPPAGPLSRTRNDQVPSTISSPPVPPVNQNSNLFGQSSNTVPSSALFGGSSEGLSLSAAPSRPVQTLQCYERKIEKREGSNRDAMRTKSADGRGPHDDAALKALSESEVTDTTQKQKEDDVVIGDLAIIDSEDSLKATISGKGKDEE